MVKSRVRTLLSQHAVVLPDVTDLYGKAGLAWLHQLTLQLGSAGSPCKARRTHEEVLPALSWRCPPHWDESKSISRAVLKPGAEMRP